MAPGYRADVKLTIRNLGRIRDAELDLRPLTVFVGKNNTNKSWTAFAAATLLRARAVENDYDGGTTFDSDDRATRAIDQVVSAVMAGGDATVDFKFPRSEIATLATNSVLDGPTFARYLKGDVALFRDLELRMDGDEQPLFDEISLRVTRSGAIARGSVELTGPGGRRALSSVVSLESLRAWVSQQVAVLTFASWWRVVLMPVERHLLLQWSQDASKLPFDRLGGPELDFLSWVLDARFGAPRETPFSGHVDTILGGKVQLDEAGIAFERGGVSVPLPLSASIVRSIAGLSLYFQRSAQPGDTLVIDEPEMNAHPEAQLGLVELFATLVNRGYRVLFTTHSPYIVDHLSALMLASRGSPEAMARLAPKFVLRSADAFVSPDLVSAYEFREDAPHVIPTDILDRETGTIDLSTFGRQTDRIGELVNAVLDETGT
jgi:hypothetical protein